MTFEDFVRVLPLLFFLVLQGIEEGLAEDCGNNIHCFSPYVCCTNLRTCCYDRDAQDSFRRAYKLHVWNMWYFWFVIIFILMSCFGGCGYYRRRRMAALEQHRRTAITTRRSPHSRGSARSSQSYLAYVGPAATDPPEISFLPPPYSEVVNQPGMYPGNKGDLPPYPGPPIIASNYAGTMPPPAALASQDLTTGSSQVPKPPPYSEFVDPAPSTGTHLVEGQAATTSQTSAQSQLADENHTTQTSPNQCSPQPSDSQNTCNN